MKKICLNFIISIKKSAFTRGPYNYWLTATKCLIWLDWNTQYEYLRNQNNVFIRIIYYSVSNLKLKNKNHEK